MNLRSVDLNLLVTFEALVTERSVSRAAERLGLTQPAVSHALGRLRKVFHDDLLVRGPTGMEPTARAHEIAAVVARSLSDIEQVLDQEWHFDPATSSRSFTLHVSDYVAPFLLPDLCARLRTQAPSVRLDIQHFRQHNGRVEPNEIHLRVAQPSDSTDTTTDDSRLLEDEYVVLMSKDHARARADLTLDSYLTLSHVKVSPIALGTNVIDDALAALGLQRQIAVTVPSWFEMRNVVARTDLVVAMPRRWATDPAFSAGCVWHPLPLDATTFAVDLRWRRRDRHEPGNQWLRTLVTHSITKDPAP
jgi:LysR family transcriptional activator of mexEF-oprN operon